MDRIEQLKACVRAKVEPFYIVKNIFGMKKVRDQGWAKKAEQQDNFVGWTNMLIA